MTNIRKNRKGNARKTLVHLPKKDKHTDDWFEQQLKELVDEAREEDEEEAAQESAGFDAFADFITETNRWGAPKIN